MERRLLFTINEESAEKIISRNKYKYSFFTVSWSKKLLATKTQRRKEYNYISLQAHNRTPA